MQQLTELFKFSSRHGDVRPSFNLRPNQRRPRPSGLAQRWIGVEDENTVLIRFYRKKFTLAVSVSHLKMKSYIISIALLAYIASTEQCYADDLRVVSDSTYITALVKKNTSGNKNSYVIKIVNSAKELPMTHNIRIESVFNFTKVYCTDRFIALTNSNTNEKAAMCVLDLTNEEVMVCEAAFNMKQDNISTYTRSKLVTTTNGCYIKTMNHWHNDDWEASKDSISLRLGDSIPNRCTIYWSYCAKTKLFSIANRSLNKKNSTHYHFTQYRSENVSTNKDVSPPQR